MIIPVASGNFNRLISSIQDHTQKVKIGTPFDNELTILPNVNFSGDLLGVMVSRGCSSSNHSKKSALLNLHSSAHPRSKEAMLFTKCQKGCLPTKFTE